MRPSLLLHTAIIIFGYTALEQITQWDNKPFCAQIIVAIRSIDLIWIDSVHWAPQTGTADKESYFENKSKRISKILNSNSFFSTGATENGQRDCLAAVEGESQKLPYPKSVFFIISNEFCERFNYYGIRSEYKKKYLCSQNT